MVVQEKVKAKGGAIFGSQRSVGLGLLRLLRLPLGDPLCDGAAFQKPARLRFEPCARTADAIATWRDSHKSEL